MSKYIMSIALLGTLLVAVPAMADYELFATWRQEKGAVYDAGFEVVTLGTLGKDGALGSTNGVVAFKDGGTGSWYADHTNRQWNNAGTDYFPNAGNWNNSTDWYIGTNGTDTTKYQDLGIVLVGSLGAEGFMGIGASGLRANMSIGVEGGLTPWTNLALALSSLAASLGVTIEKQSYLNGAKTTSTTVSNANDLMQTFMWSDLVTGLLSGGEGGVPVRFAAALRNGSSLSLVAIKGDQPEPPQVPEPATMALMGLGLAGLGLARRRMSK